MRWRNLLFDFDGTLVASAPLHAEAFRAALAETDTAGARTFDYAPLQGLTTRAAFRRLGIVDAPALEACIARKQTHYRDAVRAGRLTLYAGGRRLLRAALAAGGANFLVTSGSADSINLALEVLDLKRLFAGVITADDAPAGKPAPDPYRICLERFGLEPEASLAIEDAPSGVSAARAAGLRVAGVHNSAVAQMADFYVATLAELSIVLQLDLPAETPQ
ncbi:MAG: HAD-IA family hydrolase [Candidatus Binataceae bacterium]|nr:HAD-IA family hydrolase [Candidatus Binataceae bacterium]